MSSVKFAVAPSAATGWVASTCVLPKGLHASNSLTFAVNGGVSPLSDEVRMR